MKRDKPQKSCNIRVSEVLYRFNDSDYETWNMCPIALERAFEKYKPKAVIVVHLYGLSVDMDRVIEICQKHNVPLIEDAAESLGTTYKGKHTGTFGDYGVFSFHGVKLLTVKMTTQHIVFIKM